VYKSGRISFLDVLIDNIKDVLYNSHNNSRKYAVLEHSERNKQGAHRFMESSRHTYVVDPESPTEMARLINQDRVITQAMGGPLSSVPDPSSLRNILDLACGPGSWVLDVAFALPDAKVEGVDISRTMVDYANARARTQQLANGSFGVMDITQPLDFPDASFDLVNARFLIGVLKRDRWPSFLSECHRVLRPGGLLRLTEPVDFGTTTGDAVNHLMSLTMQAFSQVGYGIAHQHVLDIVPLLLAFLRSQGYQKVRTLPFALDCSAGTVAWTDIFRNIEVTGSQMKPLLIKLGLVTDEAFDDLRQQALIEMQQETFCGLAHHTTVLGYKPAEC
jgi:ubiquinone/menaquinone biosynthesis C-methylase UbiE